MNEMVRAQEVLQRYFGYSEFRQGQESLIKALIGGQDVLGIMPTGAGKSMCYQVPALVMEGVTIVISPLISLMKDQVDSLLEMGISAAVINSSLSSQDYRTTMDQAMQGMYKLLYVAPERLETVDFLELSMCLPIAMIAIDEAHCVSQWGHDFRLSYTRIASYIRRLPQRPRIGAFTATATPKVKADIMQLIALESPYTVTTGFDRPNLYFEVDKPKNKYRWIREYLYRYTEECGIIYCNTRKTVDALYERLQNEHISVSRYHAGLSEEERRTNQEDFLYDRSRIMVATNAFGMGIDKSNIRFVIHCNMPKNMEGYYQEAGRAGRDGVDSRCILLYSAQDIMTNRLFIEGSGSQADSTNEYDKLNQMVDYCNTEGCLRTYILNYFGEQVDGQCGNCGNCKSEIERQEITVEAQKILSCIKRMGERFGTGMVVDVLKGSKAQKIYQFKFETLSTYGIMRDYAKESIKEMIAFLIAEKYIVLAGGEFPLLTLGDRAYLVLKGQEKVMMRVVIQKFEEDERLEEHPRDEKLFSLLREIRKEMAETYNVPPFMIFSDATLYEMATYYPTTKQMMLQMSGVGEVKYEKYGESYRMAIANYVEINDIQSLPIIHTDKKKTSQTTNKKTLGSSGETYKVTYTLYQGGATLEEIARQRGLTPTTIENHLIKAMEEGQEIRHEDFMTQEDAIKIQEAIQTVGGTLLRPIKEVLPEHISYTAIKIMLAAQKKNG